MRVLHTSDGQFSIQFFDDVNVARVFLTKKGREDLGEIITMIPRVNERTALKPNGPLFSLETTRALKCLMSPIGGHIVNVNPLVDSNPNDLTAAHCLVEVHPVTGFAQCDA